MIVTLVERLALRISIQTAAAAAARDVVCQSVVERYERCSSVPADRDIARITYIGDKHLLTVNYHRDRSRIAFSTRRYSKVTHGEGLDDDVEWNTKNHAAFHVRHVCIAIALNV